MVSDRDNQRLVVLGFDGTSFAYQNSYIAGFDIPYGIAVDGKDQVYIADAGKNRIMVLEANGVIVVVDAGNRRMVSMRDPQPVTLLLLPVVARYALIDW